MVILAIETSHDDTSISILENSKVVELITLTQTQIHKKYGGTVPEIASRLHVENIYKVIEQIKTKYDLNKVNLIAYTSTPGLIGALQVGFLAAHALSLALNKPIVPINHLDGHFFSGSINKEINYPALCLLISGGHTQIIYAQNYLNLSIIGQTLDDAVGETYDKIGRKLGLEFPAGAEIDKLAYENTRPLNHKFNLPVTQNKYDLSLSGIKTQFINYINNFINRSEQIPVKDIASDFQNLMVYYLETKMKQAINEYKPKSIILAGGVSANLAIRKMFKNLHHNAIIPDLKYATDNAAMIGQAAKIIYQGTINKKIQKPS
ncbi:tRNA (adenosine(37)-N6)-threonylcarbamoyltransferase complex transferase subunit TsaD [Mycoplasma miroungirhinis]|uniref:tRNA N6-adenosine threonylcarbamoyltransferase n=1 Tax=Mycoplasma miroungirhinis TaxID=754516 RepID=A0A6M4JGU0_9MOLU|nr:tRNA (adenosine(37)-N6)-threonylcarbamoyltransferase complex transferase subunit TsaD [Mycoplasma miroungirhinis]QJR44232.1 tRNA (adenosine(37)-N6)-threonylcarbamoyltransferase complex transferase subunit TsaD [Mycoplasma miroungirhinis]